MKCLIRITVLFFVYQLGFSDPINDFEFDSKAAINYVVAYSKFDKTISIRYKNYLNNLNIQGGKTASKYGASNEKYILVVIPINNSKSGLSAILEECPTGTFSYHFVDFKYSQDVYKIFDMFIGTSKEHTRWDDVCKNETD